MPKIVLTLLKKFKLSKYVLWNCTLSYGYSTITVKNFVTMYTAFYPYNKSNLLLRLCFLKYSIFIILIVDCFLFRGQLLFQSMYLVIIYAGNCSILYVDNNILTYRIWGHFIQQCCKLCCQWINAGILEFINWTLESSFKLSRKWNASLTKHHIH